MNNLNYVLTKLAQQSYPKAFNTKNSNTKANYNIHQNNNNNQSLVPVKVNNYKEFANTQAKKQKEIEAAKPEKNSNWLQTMAASISNPWSYGAQSSESRRGEPYINASRYTVENTRQFADSLNPFLPYERMYKEPFELARLTRVMAAHDRRDDPTAKKVYSLTHSNKGYGDLQNSDYRSWLGSLTTDYSKGIRKRENSDKFWQNNLDIGGFGHPNYDPKGAIKDNNRLKENPYIKIDKN